MLNVFIQVIESLVGVSALLSLLGACFLTGVGQGRTLRRGCVAGVAGALVLALLRRNTALINLGVWSAWAMGIALVAEGLVLALFWRRESGEREKGEGRREKRPCDKVSSFDNAVEDKNISWKTSAISKQNAPFTFYLLPFTFLSAALLFYALPPVFLMPADFVLVGEGFFNTAFLFMCAGYAAGLLVVFIMALALWTIARKLSRLQLGIFFSAVTAIIALEQLAAVFRMLFARRVIPMNRAFFRVITLAVNNEIVFSFAVIAVVAALSVLCFLMRGSGRRGIGYERGIGYRVWGIGGFIRYILAFTRRFPGSIGIFQITTPHPPYPIPHTPSSPLNPAEKRKRKAEERNRRRWCITAAAFCALSFLSLTVLKRISEQAVKLSPAEAMTIAGGEIIIPSTQIEDGHLHRFALSASDGTEVRFIVVKKSASAYGVGLDACDICGATGYYERKDGIVCRLCDVVMNKSTIGFKGGCNPVPLAYTMRGGGMVILTDDLEKEKGRFQ
jgi:uncharacterized membrane protein